MAFDPYPVCNRQLFIKNDAYALLRDFFAVGWTERQMAHRHEMEKIQVRGNERRMDISQRNGFYVGLFSLACGTACIVTTNSWFGTIAAVAFVAIGVGGPIAVHIARGIRHWVGDRNTND